MKKYILFSGILLLVGELSARDTTAIIKQITGYIEPYYCYDFSDPENRRRADYIYSYNRHDELNIALGLIRLSVNDSSYRGNIGLMAGTYVNANLANEPGVLKNIYEANAGVRINRRHDLWLDAGIMPSHIGFESAIGMDSPTLTRSLQADNTPYYECGIKASYQSKNKKWFAALFVLNGWQRIAIPENVTLPSFGTQLSFQRDRWMLNSSSFIGPVSADSIRLMRYFHNLYTVVRLTDQLTLTGGIDFGIQQVIPHSNHYANWWSTAFILHYRWNKRLASALRAEYFHDSREVIIVTGSPHGFQTSGFSLNLDYSPAENVLWRVEARMLQSADPLFQLKGTPSSRNYILITSLCIKL